MMVKRGATEDMYDAVPQRLRDMAKARLPESQCPAVELTLVGTMSEYRRCREPRVSLLLVVRPARWAMRNECIQGHKWEAYVVLETFLGDGTRDDLRTERSMVTESW